MTAARRRFLALATSLSFVLVGYLSTAAPVAACSCMAPEPMAAFAGDPDRAVFSGTVQAPEPNGTPVVVTRWFHGDGAAGVVWIDGEWGQGGASCETPLPPGGTEWIFVAPRIEGKLAVNLCTPHAPVASDAGAAMLAEATTAFGAAEQPPEAPSEEAGSDAGGVLPVALVVGGVAALGLLAGLAIIARGRRPEDPAA